MLEHVKLWELLSFLWGSDYIFGCYYVKMASTGIPLCARISLLKVKPRITFLVARICPLAWCPFV